MVMPTSALIEFHEIKQNYGFPAAIGEEMISSFEDSTYIFAHLVHNNVIGIENINDVAIITEALGSECKERISNLDFESKMKNFEGGCLKKGIKWVAGWLENPGAIDLYKNRLGYTTIRIGEPKAPNFLVIKELGRPMPIAE